MRAPAGAGRRIPNLAAPPPYKALMTPKLPGSDPALVLRAATLFLLATTLFGVHPAAQESLPPVAAPPEPLDATPFFAALSVRSVEISAAWYGKVFGFEVVRKMEPPGRGLRILLLRKPGALLELVESEAARGPAELEPPLERRFLLHGVFKVGFLVEDLDDAIRRLEGLEVELRGKVFTEPDGGFRSLQVEDPDGNVVQVFERLETEPAGPAGEPPRSAHPGVNPPWTPAATRHSKTLLTLQVLQSQHQVQPAAQLDVPRGLHLPVVV